MSACCPVCGETDNINHIDLRCPNSTLSGMHTSRHHVALRFCIKTLCQGKGKYGSSLIGKDACQN
eukprot:1159739-Pelagomonas_calceolata.AAC.9